MPTHQNIGPGAIAAPPVPQLRGVSHAVVAVFSVAAAVVIIACAPTSRSTLGAAIYGAGLIALFTISGLYHRWPGRPAGKAVLRKLDHCTIYLFIAASYTPVTLMLIHGPLQIVVLAVVWFGALLGTGFSLGWIDAPGVVVAATYVGLGWACLLVLPQLIGSLPPAPLILFVAGGVTYSLGAVVHASRRPNPWPRVFGYHEVFHAMVIAAATMHYIALIGWVLAARG